MEDGGMEGRGLEETEKGIEGWRREQEGGRLQNRERQREKEGFLCQLCSEMSGYLKCNCFVCVCVCVEDVESQS